MVNDRGNVRGLMPRLMSRSRSMLWLMSVQWHGETGVVNIRKMASSTIKNCSRLGTNTKVVIEDNFGKN